MPPKKASVKKSNAQKGPTIPKEFLQAPEVKMAPDLREMVEESVKEALAQHPELTGKERVLLEHQGPELTRQLTQLGFTPVQARNAVQLLSKPSPLTSTLLNTSSPLEAAIEYLILHVPECDLPERFLPTNNSSNPFVTSTHSGTEDLRKRWLLDKASKEAGFPARAVAACTTDERLLVDWEHLVSSLGRKLVGRSWEDLFTEDNESISPSYTFESDEVEALGAHYESPDHLIMPLFSAPIKLNILLSPNGLYHTSGKPPIYITSPTVPAYIRLHLLAQLLNALETDEFIDSGGGFCMAAMGLLEGEWAKIEDDGPPDISTVFLHLIDPPSSTDDNDDTVASSNKPTGPKGFRRGKRDDRSDAQVKDAFVKSTSTEKYKAMYATRTRLPAFKAKDDFLNMLEKSRVVVVVGETGCGKTTQLPQFVLDSLILSGHGAGANIVCTQPRRISAISVAARVSAERIDDGSVGYAIRGESKQDKQTKLLFCTTGVLLRRLGLGDSLDTVTHVIVDEVHERSLDGDFLLLELKELLIRQPKLKVVLMSATINHETFIKYFNGAPLLEIPGFTHPVKDLYLEDVVSATNYNPAPSRSNRKESEAQRKAAREELQAQGLNEQHINAVENITRADRIDYQLIATIVQHIIKTSEKRGGILIFLPGVQEIRQAMDAIRNTTTASNTEILPLHANLSSDEQRRVFVSTTKWKIIAATNVAETSITIDDVVYVIDAGRVKETQYDPETSLSRLVETWVTLAAARQRRGRAGRTQPGFCYKLYTRRQEGRMGKFPVPEILRVPLESISLTVKAMRENEDVKLFLGRAIDPPEVVAMEKAWTILQELGAVDEAGRLTALGKHMSMLPVDLRLAKMLILGTIFQCLDPILTITAALSSKPLFLSPMEKRDEAAKARARFFTGQSDLLTDLRAYNECERVRKDESQSSLRAYCEQHFISTTTLREITTLRQDFLSALSDLGFIPLRSSASDPSLNANSMNTNLLKGVLTGGLWPRVGRVKLPEGAVKFDKVGGGAVQRENTAKEFTIYDIKEDNRVFLHPGSVMFTNAIWKTAFVVYFQKHMTSKVFLRDATEVPLYALLLFGGPIAVNHVAGGLTIGTKKCNVKVRAWPRIGILVNQLRRLLDAELQDCIEEGTMIGAGKKSSVLKAMLDLLTGDGTGGII